jgi:hypothetical protein
MVGCNWILIMYTLFPTYVRNDVDGSAIPLDEGNAFYQIYLEWRETNEPAQPAGPTLEQRAAALLAGVDAHLNAAAQAKGYDNILSAAIRAALPASAFHDEGVAFGTWMDAVYARCYQLMAAVQSGETAEPTLEELLAMLPVLQLPE